MARQEPVTPSAVNSYIKNILEGDLHLKKLYITGEASNVKYHSNGNIYFSIKDEKAQINCLMFKNYQLQMNEKIQEGDDIEILGNIYAYIKMGQYSINVFKMRKVGLGDLYKKYLELKNKLEIKGYFQDSNKQKIPLFPNEIGVITSPTGAAVRDIITTIKRRYKKAKITIIPTLVQGSQSAEDIANNIRFANETAAKKFDLLIVGRGGGSIEDLFAFNEEVVANAIYESDIPIISAVGHETDFTIADFVADLRAPTPTAAAELGTPNLIEIENKLNHNIKMISNIVKSSLQVHKNKLQSLKKDPYFKNPLLNVTAEFALLGEKFSSQTTVFANEIKSGKNQLENLFNQLQDNVKVQLKDNKKNIVHLHENLDNLNPLSILSKGYSVVKRDEKYIKSINDVQKDDNLEIQLRDGILLSKVVDKKGRE